MTGRKLHRVLGIILLLPMFGWVFTGLIFFIKPGYEGAYAMLPVKTYALQKPMQLNPSADWKEIRVIKTILGTHLFVQQEGGSSHLDPGTFEPKPLPDDAGVKALIADAITLDPDRYGEITQVEGTTVYTDTGIKIDLDWATLRLSQFGRDRTVIDTFYKIHYLQWSPWATLNQVLGVVGLLLLFLLSVLGGRMVLRGRGK